MFGVEVTIAGPCVYYQAISAHSDPKMLMKTKHDDGTRSVQDCSCQILNLVRPHNTGYYCHCVYCPRLELDAGNQRHVVGKRRKVGRRISLKKTWLQACSDGFGRCSLEPSSQSHLVSDHAFSACELALPKSDVGLHAVCQLLAHLRVVNEVAAVFEAAVLSRTHIGDEKPRASL